jgi:curli biogenesis system outer membrane secretion channel CsgG
VWFTGLSTSVNARNKERIVKKTITCLLAFGCLFFLVFNSYAEDWPKNKGNLRYSITVTKFNNEAGWSGQWDIGDGFGEIMTNALNESGWFIVLGEKDMREAAMEEQDFAASGRAAGGKKAPKMGRMTPAQLLVKGAITHVQESTTGGSGGLQFRGIRVGGSKDSAEINMTMYLVNSETGQVAASTKVVGQSGRKGIGVGYFGDKLKGLTGDMEGFQNDNVGKACEDAVSQAVGYLIQQVQAMPWEGSVILAKAGRVAINRGSREGVQVGYKFDVGYAEQLVDEDTGEVLDEEMTQVGTLQVTDVKEKIAYCKVLSGDVNQIQKGMTVHPSK